MPTINERQVYSIVNDLHQQLTGQAVLGGVNASNFVSVFQNIMTNGTENVFNALAVQITRRLYDSRPYNAKFRILYEDSQVFGGIIDKVGYIDDTAIADLGYTTALENGSSVNQWEVRKPLIVNTRATGYNVYEDGYTRYEDQLLIAMRSWQDFSSFWAGFLQEHANKHEQWLEEQARLLVNNHIAALVADQSTHPERVVHLVTEYNADGGSITAADLFTPAAEHFWRWVYAKYNTVLTHMGERTVFYHSQPAVPAGKKLLRHTPRNAMKCLATEKYMQYLKANVLSVTFNPDNLDMGNFERIVTWQNPNTPESIKVTPVYSADGTGTEVVGAETTVNNIFAFAFDRGALAINVKMDSVKTTPMNARGRYWNTWENIQRSYVADFTQNAVLFLLD